MQVAGQAEARSKALWAGSNGSADQIHLTGHMLLTLPLREGQESFASFSTEMEAERSDFFINTLWESIPGRRKAI